MNAGYEWIVDALDCDPSQLADQETMRAVCERLIADVDLHLVGSPQWHQFPSPGGVTGMYLLTESHLTCHTFPEFGLATFNLYCCQPHADWPWEERLRELLGTRRVSVRRLMRGPEISEVTRPTRGTRLETDGVAP